MAVGNVRTRSSHDELVTGPGSGGGPHLRVMTWTGEAISDRFVFDSWWSGGIDVAAGAGRAYTSNMGRRLNSVRRVS